MNIGNEPHSGGIIYKKRRSGFTLLETLLVVALIGVLVAISIPMLNNNLEPVRVNTDKTNEGTARTAALNDFITYGRFGDVQIIPEPGVSDPAALAVPVDADEGISPLDADEGIMPLDAGDGTYTMFYDGASGKWVDESDAKDITPYGKCTTNKHNGYILKGVMKVVDTVPYITLSYVKFDDDGNQIAEILDLCGDPNPGVPGPSSPPAPNTPPSPGPTPTPPATVTPEPTPEPTQPPQPPPAIPTLPSLNDALPSIVILNDDELRVMVTYREPKDLDKAAGDVRKLSVELRYGTSKYTLGTDLGIGSNAADDDPNFASSQPITDGINNKKVFVWTIDTLNPKGKQFKDLAWSSKVTPGNDFTAVAKVSRATDRAEVEVVSKKNNSLFDEGTSADEARIANLRHLQNLNANYSGFDTTDNKKIKALQIENIDANTAEVGTLISADGEVSHDENKKLNEYKFIPIYNNKLNGYDGNTNKITELTVTPDSANKYLKLSSDGNMQLPFAGLFAEAGGSGYTFEFNKVWLENINVVGNSWVGGLAGSAVNVKFNDCQITGSIEELKKYIKGTSGIKPSVKSNSDIAGGLVGYWTVEKPTSEVVYFDFSDCVSQNIIVEGKLSAGGIGAIGYHTKFTNCNISNSIVKSELAYAGGIIGNWWSTQDEATKKATGSSEFVGCIGQNLMITGGTSAGGLTGGGPKGIFKKCNVTFVSNDIGINVNTIIGSSYTGGIVGDVADASTFENCNVDNAVITSSSIAAGGIAGAVGEDHNKKYNITDTKPETEPSTFKNCTTNKVTITAGNYAGGLVGSLVAENGKYNQLTSCNAINATVSSNTSGGGLVGYANVGINISDCRVYWDPIPNAPTASDEPIEKNNYKIKSASAGGLVGMILGGGNIKNSFAATDVIGTNDAGGLVGMINDSEIKYTNQNMSIESSYADCYLEAIGFASGLIGSKSAGLEVKNNESESIITDNTSPKYESKLTLNFKNVYAAGYIKIADSTDTTGTTKFNKERAGLCGGPRSSKYEVTAENAYAAIHYLNPGGGHPLFENATDKDGIRTNDTKIANNVNYMESPYGWVPYFWNDKINLNDVVITLNDVVLNAPSESHPYNRHSGNKDTLTSYPYPGLKDLPHYGDWYVP